MHNDFFDFYRVGNADVNDNLYTNGCVMSLGRVVLILNFSLVASQRWYQPK